MYKCECGKKLSNKSGYATHRKYCSETNTETESFYCECCDEFDSKSGLFSHVKWCSEANRKPFKRNYVYCSLCNQKIDCRNIKSHKNSKKCKRSQLKKDRIENNKVCENFKENIVKDFGESSTGRFCSKKCARSFATKSNREKINKKVSKKLSGRKYEDRRTGRYKICSVFEEEFYVTESNKDKIFCSWDCYSKNIGNYNYMEKPSEGGGYRKNSTIKHSCEYQGQKMDSGAELKFVKLLDEKSISWNKNEQDNYYRYGGINGKNRKYYPDFYLEDFSFWVEVKSKYYQTENLDKKINSVPNIKLYILMRLKSLCKVFKII